MKVHLLGFVGFCLAGLAFLIYSEVVSVSVRVSVPTTNTNTMATAALRRSVSAFRGLRTTLPLASVFGAARPFSSTVAVKMPSKMPSSGALVELAKGRHSIYKLGRESPVSDDKIEELVNQAILNVPSAFNTQSTRLVVLLHKEHERLWEIAMDCFQGLVKNGTLSEETWKGQTQPKLQGFKNGLGTVGARLRCFA